MVRLEELKMSIKRQKHETELLRSNAAERWSSLLVWTYSKNGQTSSKNPSSSHSASLGSHTCFYCHTTDHLIAACPMLEAKPYTFC